MGSSLTLLKNSTAKDEKLVKVISELSLDNFVRYHNTFRTGRSKFNLDVEEFKHIFGLSERHFSIWDPTDPPANRVDALEIFAGGIILARISFENQAKLLFDLFDFNESGSLTIMEIELLVVFILNSLFKLFDVKAEPNAREITETVQKLCKGKERLNFSELYSMLSRASEVAHLYEAINKFVPGKEKLPKAATLLKTEKLLTIEKITEAENHFRKIPSYLLHPKAIQQNHSTHSVDSELLKTKVNVLASLIGGQVCRSEPPFQVLSSRLELNWVYGFAADTSVKNFALKISSGPNSNAKDENAIIYFVSNIVILYHDKTRRQKFFLEHSGPISALAVSPSGKTCASGQKGAITQVLVWQTDELKTIRSIAGLGGAEVYLLEFLSDEQYLVSCYKRPDTPIFVHDLETGTLMTSTYLKNFVLWISPIVDLSGNTAGLKTQTEGIWSSSSARASFVCVAVNYLEVFAFNPAEKNYSSMSVFPFGEQTETFGLDKEKVNVCVALFMHRQNPQSLIYKINGNFDLFLICGTKRGSLVVVSNLANNSDGIANYKIESLGELYSSIIAVAYDPKGQVYLATENCQLHKFTLSTRKIEPIIDLKASIQVKSIKNIQSNHKGRLFVSTWQGELFQLKFSQTPAEKIYNKNKSRTSVKKLHRIFSLDNGFERMVLVEGSQGESVAYIGGAGRQILGLSTKARKIVANCLLDEPVSCLDYYDHPVSGIVFVFGTQAGSIRIRRNSVFAPKYFRCEHAISTVRLSPSGAHLVAGTAEPSVYLFTHSQGHYFNDPLKILLKDQIPVSINFCTSLINFIVGMNNLKHYLFSTVDFHKKIFEELNTSGRNAQVDFFTTRYSLDDEKSMRPVLYDQQTGFIVVGEREGTLSIFDSVSNLKENCATVYFAHDTKIDDVSISKSKTKLFSLAGQDGALLEWKLDLSLLPNRKGETGEKNAKAVGGRGNCSEDFQRSVSGSILRQRVASSLPSFQIGQLCDSFGYFRGFSNVYMRKIFGEKFGVFDETEGLSKRFPAFSLQLDHVYGYDAFYYRNNVFYIHRLLEPQPIEDLKVAIDTRMRRISNKVGWSHPLYSATKVSLNEMGSRANFSEKNYLKKIRNNQSLVGQPNAQKVPWSRLKVTSRIEDHHKEPIDEPQLNTENPIQDDKEIYSQHFGSVCQLATSSSSHNDQNAFYDVFCPIPADQCYREIVYFISRLAVVVDPTNATKQRIYQGHNAKISALTVHPHLPIVASGEATDKPKICVWKAANCSTLSVINTHHALGIICLKFSLKHNLLISVSADEGASVQISDWQLGRALAYRNTSDREIIDLAIDPADPYCFVTISADRVDYWCFKDHSIVLLFHVSMPFYEINEALSSVSLLTYWTRGELCKDILLATSEGQVVIIRGRQLLKAINLGFERKVNLLRIFILRGNTFIFLATNDSFVLVYNINFEKVAQINLSASSKIKQDDQKAPNEKSKAFKEGVQSLDLYLKNSNCLLILASLKTGKIVEAALNFSFDSQSSNAIKIEPQSEESKLLISGHASLDFKQLANPLDFTYHRRVYISASPSHNILATCGDDGSLRIYQSDTRKLLLVKQLGQQPSCLKFSPNGNILAIGMINGKSTIFEPRITVNKIDPTIQGISLEVDIREPIQTIDSYNRLVSVKTNSGESGVRAVLNIEFSQRGDFLAISYDNVKSEDQSSSMSDGCKASVVVYLSKDSDLRDNAVQMRQNEHFVRYTEILLASLSYADGSSISHSKMACHFMNFSDDDTYLMLYYQHVNVHHIRENRDKDGKYVVWNFKSQSSEINWDILKYVQFSNNNFPNHVYGVNSLLLAQAEVEVLNEPQLDTNAKTELASNKNIVLSALKEHFNVCFLGSDAGNLFVAKKQIFALPANQSPENLIRAQLCQAKRYKAHASFLNQIEIDRAGRYLFTTGISDECVFQWQISAVDEFNDLDHLDNSLIREAEENCLKLDFRKSPFETERQNDDKENDQSIVHKINHPSIMLFNKQIRSQSGDYAKSNKQLNSARTNNQTSHRLNVQTHNDKPLDKAERATAAVAIDHQASIAKKEPANFKPEQLCKQGLYRSLFDHLVSEVYPQRKCIPQLLQDVNISLFPHFKLKLFNILGRQAMNSRPSLAVIPCKYLIYSAGTAMVLLDIDSFSQASDSSSPNLNSENGSRSEVLSTLRENSKMTSLANIDSKPPSKDQTKEFTIIEKPVPTVLSHFGQSKNYNSTNDQNKTYIEEQGASKFFLVPTIVGKTKKSNLILFPGRARSDLNPAEIGCFELAPDKSTMCVGTNDIFASLFFWDITSNSFKGSVQLVPCISPLLIRFSSDLKNVIVLGLNQQHTACLYYIDILKYEVLGVLDLLHSPPHKIWDVAFLPARNDKFLTVGLIHAAYWKYRAGLLEFKELRFEQNAQNENIFGLNKRVESVEKSSACFLRIKFLYRDVFVTGSSDGHLSVWNNYEQWITRRVYDDSPVFAIEVHPENAHDFLTAGFAAPICYYRILEDDKQEKLVKLFQMDIFDPPAKSLKNVGALQTEISVILPEYQIDSILISGLNQLIYSTRSGNLGIVNYGSQLQSKNQTSEFSFSPQKRYKYQQMAPVSAPNIDFESRVFYSINGDQVPLVADFSIDSKTLYCLTEEGIFSAYELDSLEKVYSWDFQKAAIDMHVVDNLIVLVFEGLIRFIAQDSTAFVLKSHALECVRPMQRINKVRIHLKQGVLAIAVHGVPTAESKNNYDNEQPQNYSNQNSLRKSLNINMKTSMPQNPNSMADSAAKHSKLQNKTLKVKEERIVDRHNSPLIEIYSLSMPPRWLYSVRTEEIELLDFSDPTSEECFLMCQDVCGKVTVFRVHNGKVSLERDEQIEWASEGILISESSKKLQSSYSSTNNVVSVLRVDKKTIAVNDELGTVS